MISCDPAGYVEFYIRNECDMDLNISVSFDLYKEHREWQIKDSIILLQPHANKFITTFMYNTSTPDKWAIKKNVHNISISNADTLISIDINPNDTEIWTFEESPKSKRFAYRTIATLSIKSELFEK